MATNSSVSWRSRLMKFSSSLPKPEIPSMTMKTFLLTILVAASLRVFAAGQPAPLDLNSIGELTDEVLKARTDVRKQADLLNDALKMVNTNNTALSFLKALNIKFKVFEGGTNDAATLGVEYNYDKS